MQETQTQPKQTKIPQQIGETKSCIHEFRKQKISNLKYDSRYFQNSTRLERSKIFTESITTKKKKKREKKKGRKIRV